MSQQRWAGRVQEIQPFHVMAVLARARALEAHGRDVIHMEIGEPDFTTPEPIVRAGQQALADGCTGYTPALGLPALREAIAGLYRQRHGLDVDPARIVVTPGGSAALLLVSALLVEPGRKVLMADPAYPCNRHFLRLVEGRAVLVPTGPETNYQLTPELVEQHWGADCVAVLAASPANPTGTLLSRQELAALSATCRRLGGELIVDEIYHGLTYGLDAPSVLEVADDAFVLNSFSKYFGMTGWRVGWLVAPEGMTSQLEKLAQNFWIAPSTPGQHAALAALGDDAIEIHESRRRAFCERRNHLVKGLRAIGLNVARVPEGAFYVYAGLGAIPLDSSEFCTRLLVEAGVAATPGTDFGEYEAARHVRFAYTGNVARIDEALTRIEEFVTRVCA